MKVSSFLVSLWLISVAQSLFAFRLDQAGFSMHTVPVTDQKDSYFCYAFAAAQMLDAYRLTYGGSQRNAFQTSPLALVADAYGQNDAYTCEGICNEGGMICDAVNAGLQQGLTAEDATHALFESFQSTGVAYKKYDSFSYSKQIDKTYQRLLHLLRRSIADFKAATGKGSLAFSEYGRDEMMEELRQLGLGAEALISHTDLMAQGKPESKLHPSAFTSKRLVFASLVKELGHSRKQPFPVASAACQEWVRDSQPDNSATALVGLIRAELARGTAAQPLGLSYCSNFFWEGPDYAGAGDVDHDPGCNAHASLVIGVRTRGKKRSYLIRDSYGSECGGDSMKLHPSYRCDHGNLWVSEDTLKENLLGVAKIVGQE